MFQKFLIISLLAFLLATSPALAATPDPASAAEWKKAETLLVTGKAGEAYPIFATLLQRFPGHSSLTLGLARSAALTGRYQEADSLYRELLRRYPGDPVLLNESDQVKALLSETGSPTTVSFRMRTGLTYDSNANQGANDYIRLNLGNIPLPPLPGTKRIGTMGAYFGANLNLSHRLSESSPWSFVGDSGFYIRGNEDSDLDDLKSSEWQWFRVGAGLRYAKGQNLFEFRMKWEIFDYELTNHVTSWGPELTYLRAITPKFHLITQLSVDWRDYQRNPDRDGHYGQLAQYGRWFFGDNTHSLTFGVGYLWGRPEDDDLGYQGYTIPLRLTFRPNETWELSPNINYIYEKYRGQAIIFDRDDRVDKKIRSGLDVVYKLNDQWRVEFNYSYNRASSNSVFYDYAQHTVSLGLSWGF